MHDLKIDDAKLDALKELGNIGAAHAANSLSKILGRLIMITVPRVELLLISDVYKKFREDTVIGILTAIQDLNGKCIGYIYSFFPLDSSKKITRKLCNSDVLDEMGVSAITEVGNILSSSFCNAIAEFLNTILLPSPPNFAIDFTIVIIDAVISKLAQNSDYLIMFETKLHDEEELRAYFMLIPEVEFFDCIMNVLGGYYEQ